MLLNFDSDHLANEAEVRYEVMLFAENGSPISNDAAQFIAGRYAPVGRVSAGGTFYDLATGENFDPKAALVSIDREYRRLEKDFTNNVRELMELHALAALIHKSTAAAMWHLA